MTALVRRLADIANTFAGVVLGLYLLLLVLLRPLGLLTLADCLTNTWLAGPAFLLAVFLLLVNGWDLWTWWREGSLRKNLHVTTENGESIVSVGALEDILKKELASLDDVRGAAVKLDVQGEAKPIVCRLRFKLRRQADILARVDVIKRRVRETFENLLPSGVGLELYADVIGFVEEPAKRDAELFSGPSYDGYTQADDGQEEHPA